MSNSYNNARDREKKLRSRDYLLELRREREEYQRHLARALQTSSESSSSRPSTLPQASRSSIAPLPLQDLKPVSTFRRYSVNPGLPNFSPLVPSSSSQEPRLNSSPRRRSMVNFASSNGVPPASEKFQSQAFKERLMKKNSLIISHASKESNAVSIIINQHSTQSTYSSTPPQAESTISSYQSIIKDISSNLKEDNMVDKSFDPIVGNISLQMLLHYSWYGFILIVGNEINLLGTIRPASVMIYFSIAIIVLQISRLIYSRNPLSFIPLYLSNIPFIFFCVIAKNSHILFSLLWFVTVMMIHMQCDARHLRTQMFFSSIVFLLCYTFFLYLVIPSSPINLYNSRFGGIYPNFEVIDINVYFEVMFYIFIGLFQICLFMLQRFLIRYRFYLMDRGKKMHRLQKVNQELQDKLDNLDKEQFLQEQISNLDVDSPITKVIQMIREIQKKMIHAEVIESLEYAIRLLSSNKLFQIDLNSFKQDIDNDLKAWLNNLLHQNEPEAEAGIELPSLKEEGSMQLLTHKHRFDEEEEYSALSWEIPQFDTNTKLMDVLGKSQSWDFNCFDLAEATNGQPLCHLVIHLLTYYDLFNKLKLDRQKVDRCLKKIDQGYRLNPYHNSIHASDVTQTFHFFLSTMHLADHFSHEEIFACIMAAAIHDLDHPGVNNVYLIETRHSLCLRYNDQSVLENHHCTKGFEWLLVNPETNFLSDLPLTSLRHIRQCMIKMVLATDMVGHFEHVSKFKNKVQSQGILFKDLKDRLQVMEIGLKCADISNPTKMPALSQKWAELVLAEFFLQGDLEREHGMNISRFMDRNIPSVSKCQLGFMDFIVTPMYEVWSGFMTTMLSDNKIEGISFPALDNIGINKAFWKSFVDPPPSATLSISSIRTPDYLVSSLSSPLNLNISPANFVLRPTVCKMLPAPTVFTPLQTLEKEKRDASRILSSHIIEVGQDTKTPKSTI